jgi:hypothetical protein
MTPRTDTLSHPSANQPFAAIRRYPVTLGRFESAQDRAVVDELVDWVEVTYQADLAQRPSKHVYLRHLPQDVLLRMDQLRFGPAVYEAIGRPFGPDWRIIPMAHTDELYLSHYNKDKGGDQGLFDKHYDGNLRFVSFGVVVRALIYLQSDRTYKVVFADSRVEKAFGDYEFGILDFHRELHWVEGEYRPEDRQRILLKCNYLLVPPGGGLWQRVMTHAVMAANTGVFYVVKAAMEYSKSPKNLPQRLVGHVCNWARSLNNIHPVLPLALLAALLALAVWGTAVAVAMF